jgi:hypothetical protein
MEDLDDGMGFELSQIDTGLMHSKRSDGCARTI